MFSGRLALYLGNVQDAGQIQKRLVAERREIQVRREFLKTCVQESLAWAWNARHLLDANNQEEKDLCL